MSLSAGFEFWGSGTLQANGGPGPETMTVWVVQPRGFREDTHPINQPGGRFSRVPIGKWWEATSIKTCLAAHGAFLSSLLSFKNIFDRLRIAKYVGLSFFEGPVSGDATMKGCCMWHPKNSASPAGQDALLANCHAGDWGALWALARCGMPRPETRAHAAWPEVHVPRFWGLLGLIGWP